MKKGDRSLIFGGDWLEFVKQRWETRDCRAKTRDE